MKTHRTLKPLSYFITALTATLALLAGQSQYANAQETHTLSGDVYVLDDGVHYKSADVDKIGSLSDNYSIPNEVNMTIDSNVTLTGDIIGAGVLNTFGTGILTLDYSEELSFAGKIIIDEGGLIISPTEKQDIHITEIASNTDIGDYVSGKFYLYLNNLNFTSITESDVKSQILVEIGSQLHIGEAGITFESKEPNQSSAPELSSGSDQISLAGDGIPDEDGKYHGAIRTDSNVVVPGFYITDNTFIGTSMTIDGIIELDGNILKFGEPTNLLYDTESEGTTHPAAEGTDNINVTITGAIQPNSGSLLWNSSGTLTLSGSVDDETSGGTSEGGLEVNKGTVHITKNNVLGSGTVLFHDGTLEASNTVGISNNITFEKDTTITVNEGGNLTLTVGTLADENVDDVATVVDFNGKSLTKTGAGTLTFAKEITNLNNITISAGTLAASKENQLGTGTITLNGGTFQATDDITINVDNKITFSAASTIQVDDLKTLTVSSIDFNNNSLTKNGAGTLTLTKENTNLNGITISEGTLEVSNANQLKTSTITLDGGTLQAANSMTMSNPVTLTKDSTIGTKDSGVAFTISGNVDYGGYRLTKTGEGTLTFTGNATGAIIASPNAVVFDAPAGETIKIKGDIYSNGTDRGNVSIISSGRVDIQTTYLNTLEIESGSFSPGNSPYSEMVVENYSLLTGATLILEIDGTETNEYDLITVTNSAKVETGSTINLVLNAPTTLGTLDLILLDFSAVTSPVWGTPTFDVDNIAGWDNVEYGYNTTTKKFWLTAGNGGDPVDPPVLAVPEPTAWALLLLGALTLLGLRRFGSVTSRPRMK